MLILRCLIILGLGKNLIDLKTFSIANKVRDVKIFEQYAFYMIDIAQKKLSFKDFCLHGKFYAIDSTTIDLCMPFGEHLKTLLESRFT